MGLPASNARTEPDLAAELLEFFYPVHYRTEKALEDELRGGLLTRKQVAILWLIRSEGVQGRQMRRKDIERFLQAWFEVSGAEITRTLRSMARPPLGIVRIVEDPRSGREKQVWLTQKGERLLQDMVERGRQFLQRIIIAQLSEDVVRNGIEFLRQGIAAFERIQQQAPTTNGREKDLRKHTREKKHKYS
jgi:DNA-binding PadR family transcriptional regulator